MQCLEDSTIVSDPELAERNRSSIQLNPRWLGSWENCAGTQFVLLRPSPDDPGASARQQRLQELMNEQLNGPALGAATGIPTTGKPDRDLNRPYHRLGIGLAVGLALIVGLQFGALPWRFRREIWQVQGALLGLAVGVVIGRFSFRKPD